LALIEPLANIHEVDSPEHGHPAVVYKIVPVLETVHITWWDTNVLLFCKVIEVTVTGCEMIK
jgi:hypothetical protein